MINQLIKHLKRVHFSKPGSADIIIFDPNRKEKISIDNQCTHHMNVDYNSYEGFEVTGFTETVLSRGKIIIKNCEYTGKKGDGQFLKRGLYGGMK